MGNNQPPLGRTQGGFTLIEVLVAFAILSLALGGFYHVFATGLNTVERTERRGRAMLVAQSVMAGVGPVTPLKAGHYEGVGANANAWRVRISPYLDDQAVPADGTAPPANQKVKVQLMLVEVDVDVGGVPLTLRSLRLTGADTDK